jgi:hypothetical protein
MAPTTTAPTTITTTTTTVLSPVTTQPAAEPMPSPFVSTWLPILAIAISLGGAYNSWQSRRTSERSAGLTEQRQREEQAPTIEYVSAKEAPEEGVRLVNGTTVGYTSVPGRRAGGPATSRSRPAPPRGWPAWGCRGRRHCGGCALGWPRWCGCSAAGEDGRPARRPWGCSRRLTGSGQEGRSTSTCHRRQQTTGSRFRSAWPAAQLE